jgi:uncharacterized membrane protein
MSAAAMTEQEFLSALKLHLEAHQVLNIQDILNDYREHFVHGRAKGKTEEQICTDLGNPVTIAKAYEAENLIREVKTTKHTLQWTVAFKVLGRIFILAPINFFMLLIPGVILAALLFTGWAASFTFAALAFAALWVMIQASVLSLSAWAGIAVVSGSLGFVGLAIITAMIVFLFSKLVLLTLLSYLQWNLKFILEK